MNLNLVIPTSKRKQFFRPPPPPPPPPPSPIWSLSPDWLKKEQSTVLNLPTRILACSSRDGAPFNSVQILKRKYILLKKSWVFQHRNSAQKDMESLQRFRQIVVQLVRCYSSPCILIGWVTNTYCDNTCLCTLYNVRTFASLYVYLFHHIRVLMNIQEMSNAKVVEIGNDRSTDQQRKVWKTANRREWSPPL